MKIMLINPPITVYKGGTNPRIYMPIGLLYIAGQLEKEGHRVEVFDTLLSGEITEGDVAGERHFGESWDKVSRRIEKFRPDALGITSMFSSQSRNVKKTAEIAKSIDKNMVTVVGGPHPSANPQDMSNAAHIDFTVIGEGELVIQKILSAVKGENPDVPIRGVCGRYAGSVTVNTAPERINDLDILPFPAYHLYDMERYFYMQTHGYCARPIGYGKREVSVITSRGCPHSCVFCSIHPAMGKKWRAHSANYVLEHIEHLYNRYRIDTVHIEDDNFSLDRPRFIKIMDGLVDKHLPVKWDPTNGLRADSLDEETLSKAIRSGCQYMVIAIESGVQRVLDEVIGKKIRLDKILDIAAICRRLKLDLFAYYVVGMPGESYKEIKDTFEFAKRMLFEYFIYPQIAIAAPVFGSRLYDICKENGYLADELTPENLGRAYDAHGKGLIATPDFSPEDLKGLLAGYNRFFTLIMIFNCIRRPLQLGKHALTVMRNPYLLKRLIFIG
jgi:anaerobic magnesium-protoporphyrin IX monomethyl ester cyclase